MTNSDPAAASPPAPTRAQIEEVIAWAELEARPADRSRRDPRPHPRRPSMTPREIAAKLTKPQERIGG